METVGEQKLNINTWISSKQTKFVDKAIPHPETEGCDKMKFCYAMHFQMKNMIKMRNDCK